MNLSCYFAALLVLACVITAGAADHVSVSAESDVQISGVIVDWQDARIVDASILVEGKNFRRQQASDQSGEFTVALPIGTYRVSVRHPVFKTYVIKKLRVSESGISALRVMLRVKTPMASGGKCPKGHVCL